MKTRPDGYNSQCKTCAQARCRDYYARNSRQLTDRKLARVQERMAEDSLFMSNAMLWTKYRLRRADYDAKLAGQGGRCGICRTDTPRGKWRRFAVDHDHECCPGSKSCGLCVRALLCDGCNNGTGLTDNPELLRQKADYIETWRADRIRRTQELSAIRT